MASSMLFWCMGAAVAGVTLAGECGTEACEDSSLLQQNYRRQAPETGVACNNGNLQNGVCVCDSGWSGKSCDVPEELIDENGKPDGETPPDEEIDCENGYIQGGVVCVCDPGWAGEACDIPEEEIGGGDDGGLGGAEGEVCNSSDPVKMSIYPYLEREFWATNYAGWETCGGKKQSPITIWSRHAVREKSDKLDVDFGADARRVVTNQGHSVQVNGEFGNVTIGGTSFVSSQFHFHTPAEHRVDGYLPEAEMHIVSHNSDFSAAAVVGIFFDIGPPNKCLQALLEHPVPRAGCKRSIGKFDLSCFDKQFSGPWWNYQGSLTTPPCLEVVNWNVMKRRATISRKQLKSLRLRYPGGNNREVQPLNDRKVVYKMPCKRKSAKKTTKK